MRLAGHVVPALAGATNVPRSWLESVTGVVHASDSEQLNLTIVLRHDDEEGFQQYLADTYDPQSPTFHKFLSAVDLAKKFGPSQEAYDRVLAYLDQRGMKLVQGSANRMTLTVRAARTDAESAFDVRIGNYTFGARSFYANDADPSLPADVAAHVQAITGLSNLAMAHAPQPQIKAIQRAICSIIVPLNVYLNRRLVDPEGTSTLAEQQAAYRRKLGECLAHISDRHATQSYLFTDPPPPAWQGADGTGQTVGLLEFDTFNLSDVADFIALVGLPATKIADITQVHVNGGAGAAPGPNQDEVLLDIDDVLSFAPGAKIAVYDGPFNGNTSFQAMFNAMVGDGVDIISNSWSYCEDQTTLADVQSIDAILQGAAAAGISVFNGSGDNGSTCLDGAANTIGVPASSPSATAVGGTSLKIGPADTYASETWWNGSNDTPSTGQGGFGVSRFFARPAYQNGLNSSASRSIPDVAANADPAHGFAICNASEGGCPTAALFGGTSMSAPTWAAFTAQLNQAQGSNLGALNPQLYPLAGSAHFHDAASMGSDFAHVGLGSPRLALLHQSLTNQTAGPVDAALSQVRVYGDDNFTEPADSPLAVPVFADGTSKAYVIVRLVDANANLLIGKTVSLAANAGTHVTITPSSGVTTSDNGAVVFTVTDATAEAVTFTATDVTDSVTLGEKPSLNAIPPMAASGNIVELTDTTAADGVATNTITVTLKDALNRPTPGALVVLKQTGNSVISGPNPSVTDASGQIQFIVTDTVQQDVTYTAIDATDGDLPVPGSVTVTFNAGGGDNCGSSNFGDPNITAASGYAITPYATGFLPKITNFGGLSNNGCRGASGLAFDASGNLFVSDLHTGNIYKFASGGGVAGAGTLITPTPLGPGVQALAFGKDGKLYAAQQATTGNFLTGAVLEINPVNGSVVRTVASSITCAGFLATDPFSGDVFVDDSCGGGGSDNASIWRIANPGSATPTTSVYATTTDTNGGLSFGPGGTLYVIDYYGTGLSKVTGTTAATPGQLTQLNGVTSPALDILALGAQANGDAQTLVVSTAANTSLPAGMKIFDATTSPIKAASMLVNNAYATVNVLGPDGCLYASLMVAVYKITNADGSCPLDLRRPTLTLSPSTIAPSPAQGTAQAFTSSLHFATAPAGTPVMFEISGANAAHQLGHIDGSGNAVLSYAATKVGKDVIVASMTVGGNLIVSNPASVTWSSGAHATFLSLNPSPLGSTTGQPVTVVASLTDISTDPASALAGQTVHFTLGAATCSGTTAANGTASCSLTPPTSGAIALTASFAGTSSYLPSSATNSFDVLLPAAAATTSTSTSLTATPNPVSATQNLTLTATVTGSSPTPNGSAKALIAAVPSGNVTFTDGGTAIGVVALDANGQAVFVTANLAVGDHSLIATYAGDTSNASSASSPIAVTVLALEASSAVAAPLSTWALLLLVLGLSFGAAAARRRSFKGSHTL